MCIRDSRSYARQGKFEIPTIHEGADARKIDEKFQNGQTSSASWKVEAVSYTHLEMIEKLPKEKQQRIINAVRALVE